MISLNRIFKNNLVKNILNVSFFTILAQVVGIISLPIITRIYSPSDFGLYSFFVTVMSISGLLATGKFDSAILVSENKTKRKNLMKIILLISISASFCFLALFFIVDLFNLEIFQLENKYELLSLALLSIIFYANTASFTFWHNTKSRYTLLGIGQLLRASSAAIIKISLGVGATITGAGLIYGYVASQAILLILFFTIFFINDLQRNNLIPKKEDLLQHISSFKETIKEYKDFPKFALPTDFISHVSSQAPILLTGPIFGGTTLGFFALARTILGLPTQILGSAVRTVFQREAAKEFNKNGTCKKVFLNTFFILSGAALIPCIITMLYAEPIFVFIFGEEWEMAGTYCEILAPLFFIRMVSKPLNFMFHLSGHLKFDLQLMNIFLVFSAISFFFGWHYESAIIAFTLISALHSIGYLIYLFFSYKFASGFRLSSYKKT